MNPAQLFYDVKTRLTADTAAAGLYPAGGTPLVTGIFNNYASPNQDMPYIMWDLISGVDDGTFAGDEDQIEFQLAVFAAKRPADLLRVSRILNRIYGDGIKQTTRIPTYGLHRYTMPGVWPDKQSPEDKWNYTPCIARGSFDLSNEEYYHMGRVWTLRMVRDFASTQ